MACSLSLAPLAGFARWWGRTRDISNMNRLSRLHNATESSLCFLFLSHFAKLLGPSDSR